MSSQRTELTRQIKNATARYRRLIDWLATSNENREMAGGALDAIAYVHKQIQETTQEIALLEQKRAKLISKRH